MRVNKYIYLAGLLLALFMPVSCSKEKMPDITGDWKLDDISTVTKGNTYGINVYLTFESDGTFCLWQQLQEGLYECYQGEWSNREDVIYGTYDDGNPWGCGSYKAAIKKGALKLTAQNDTKEVTTYVRTTIPDEVKASAERNLTDSHK